MQCTTLWPLIYNAAGQVCQDNRSADATNGGSVDNGADDHVGPWRMGYHDSCRTRLPCTTCELQIFYLHLNRVDKSNPCRKETWLCYCMKRLALAISRLRCHQDVWIAQNRSGTIGYRLVPASHFTKSAQVLDQNVRQPQTKNSTRSASKHTAPSL